MENYLATINFKAIDEACKEQISYTRTRTHKGKEIQAVSTKPREILVISKHYEGLGRPIVTKSFYIPSEDRFEGFTQEAPPIGYCFFEDIITTKEIR
jgi:aromatic ring-opening dioxygenase catalytic subunit (LigB family)